MYEIGKPKNKQYKEFELVLETFSNEQNFEED